MREKSFSGRFIRPVATLLVVMTVSYVVYKSAWKVENHFLHQWLSHVFGLILFISLGFGALYVYRKTYFSGAGLGERVLACLVCPFFWSTKEVIVLSNIYTLGEALYFYINPVNVLLYSAVLAEIGLSEILCRRRAARLEGAAGGFSLAGLAALVVGLFSVVFMFAWDLGVHHFYIFQEGYKALFGYGTGM